MPWLDFAFITAFGAALAFLLALAVHVVHAAARRRQPQKKGAFDVRHD